MRHILVLAITTLIALTAIAQRNDSPEVMLRVAMDKETVDGDLKAAIEGYKKVLAKAGTNRAVAAQALVRLGICYERQGSAEARSSYDRVVREFGDQREAAAQARTRLAGLGSRAVSSGAVVRQVWPNVGSEPRLWGDISPDGRYLSHTIWGVGDLAVRDLETGQSRLVTRFPVGNKDGVEFSKFSPDGKRIVFSWETTDRWELRVIHLDGSNMKTIYTTRRQVDPNGWSPDGRRVLATDWQRGQPSRLIWVNVADGAVQDVKAVDYEARVSPDGKLIVYSEGTRLHVMDAEGGNDVVLGTYSGMRKLVGWSGDGKHLFLTRSNSEEVGLWAVPFEGGKAAGAPLLVRRDLGPRVDTFGVTRAGSVMYSTVTNLSDVYTAELDPTTGKVTSAPERVPVERTGSNLLPRWSPGGHELAYFWSKGESELSIYSFDTKQTRRLPKGVYAGGPVCWAEQNAMQFNGKGERGMAWVRMDLSTGAVARLYEWGSRPPLGRTCDTKGKWIATADPAGLHVLDVSAGTNRRIRELSMNPGQTSPAISPDGSMLAYIQSGTETSLMVVNVANGEARTFATVKWPTNFQRQVGIAWSPDGRYIYFVKRASETSNGPWELYRIPASGGAEESTGLKGAELRHITISPDGRRVAFTAGSSSTEVWALDNPLAALHGL
ncbi:MAG: hypothetical protein U0R19_39080 [Bryobacteraceae bacterium]